jgi:hypothetical protein
MTFVRLLPCRTRLRFFLTGHAGGVDYIIVPRETAAVQPFRRKISCCLSWYALCTVVVTRRVAFASV